MGFFDIISPTVMSILMVIIIIISMTLLFFATLNIKTGKHGKLMISCESFFGTVMLLFAIIMTIRLVVMPSHNVSSIASIRSRQISSNYEPYHNKFYEAKDGRFKHTVQGSVYYEPIHHSVKGQPNDYIHTTSTKYYYTARQGIYKIHNGSHKEYIIDFYSNKKSNLFWFRSVRRTYVPKDIHMTTKHPANNDN